MNNSVKTRPQRRLTQAELDAFLAKDAESSQSAKRSEKVVIENRICQTYQRFFGWPIS